MTLEAWIVGLAVVAGCGLCFGLLPKLAGKKGELMKSTVGGP